MDQKLTDQTQKVESLVRINDARDSAIESWWNAKIKDQRNVFSQSARMRAI